MKYLIFICVGNDVRLSDAEKAEIGPATERWVSEMDGRGVRLMGQQLRPASESTCVRVRNGKLTRTDGPFAETKEQIGGFDLLECRDLEEAIEVASKHPVAKFGTIEVRAFWEG